MRRDPIEKEKIEYMKNIIIRKIHPRFFYHRCSKCGYEYKNETMFECSTSDPPFSWTLYYEGCKPCFKDEDTFRKWLEETGRLQTYESYKTLIEKMLNKTG